jgi:hypothetical protein
MNFIYKWQAKLYELTYGMFYLYLFDITKFPIHTFKLKTKLCQFFEASEGLKVMLFSRHEMNNLGMGTTLIPMPYSFPPKLR